MSNAPSLASAAVDCPLRDRPYSTATPLIDLLLNPAARAATEQAVPILKGLPPNMFGTSPPTFAAIHTVQSMLEMLRQPPTDLSALDRALKAIPVTAADKIARCARYDTARPVLAVPPGKPRILLFEKITGVRDGASVDAARAAVQAMAARRGWAVVLTDKGGAMTPAILSKVDVVLWNNVSGDVLTLTQRRDFRAYIERGGGFVGIHGSGGDPNYDWDWYVDTLIGARFIGHPADPQFQDARVNVDDLQDSLARGLPPAWTMKDEWYSFAHSPRTTGAHVVATLDEKTYVPSKRGRDLRMGDHPIAWTRCIADGRSFYSAIGHRPETYSDPNYVRLIENAIAWAAGLGDSACLRGKEVSRVGNERG
jgi:type 1 glutamine amidotransferase